MKSLLFLVLPLLGFVLGEECQCPEVKCPNNNAAELCQCLNSRERLCHEHCPDYVPLYRPCPIVPPVGTSTPVPPKCECDKVYCPLSWPESCYCQNAGAVACFEKCGGDKPVPLNCGTLGPRPTLVTKTLPPVVPTSTRTRRPTPSPTGAHAICGGGRGNYLQCEDGYVCMKDPFKPGCGPECDGLGICVKDKMCGGFAGLSCEEKGQVCVDDPRDDCDPKRGGADCGGLCVWKSN